MITSWDAPCSGQPATNQCRQANWLYGYLSVFTLSALCVLATEKLYQNPDTATSWGCYAWGSICPPSCLFPTSQRKWNISSTTGWIQKAGGRPPLIKSQLQPDIFASIKLASLRTSYKTHSLKHAKRGVDPNDELNSTVVYKIGLVTDRFADVRETTKDDLKNVLR